MQKYKESEKKMNEQNQIIEMKEEEYLQPMKKERKISIGKGNFRDFFFVIMVIITSATTEYYLIPLCFLALLVFFQFKRLVDFKVKVNGDND